MITYKYCVYDDDHVINNKCFDNFAEAFDYAQDGLYTYIEEIPFEDGVELEEESDIVWSWDDVRSKEEAVNQICKLHNNCDDLDEWVSVEVKSDEPEDLVTFAKSVLGDNIESFDQDFEEVIPAAELDVKPRVEEKLNDNAVKNCKVSKVIAHCKEEKPTCDVEKPLDKPLTDDSEFHNEFYKKEELDEATLQERSLSDIVSSGKAAVGAVGDVMNKIYSSYDVVPMDEKRTPITNKTIKGLKSWKDAVKQAKNLGVQYSFAKIVGVEPQPPFAKSKISGKSIKNNLLQSFEGDKINVNNTEHFVTLFNAFTKSRKNATAQDSTELTDKDSVKDNQSEEEKKAAEQKKIDAMQKTADEHAYARLKKEQDDKEAARLEAEQKQKQYEDDVRAAAQEIVRQNKEKEIEAANAEEQTRTRYFAAFKDRQDADAAKQKEEDDKLTAAREQGRKEGEEAVKASYTTKDQDIENIKKYMEKKGISFSDLQSQNTSNEKSGNNQGQYTVQLKKGQQQKGKGKNQLNASLDTKKYFDEDISDEEFLEEFGKILKNKHDSLKEDAEENPKRKKVTTYLHYDKNGVVDAFGDTCVELANYLGVEPNSVRVQLVRKDPSFAKVTYYEDEDLDDDDIDESCNLKEDAISDLAKFEANLE